MFLKVGYWHSLWLQNHFKILQANYDRHVALMFKSKLYGFILSRDGNWHRWLYKVRVWATVPMVFRENMLLTMCFLELRSIYVFHPLFVWLIPGWPSTSLPPFPLPWPHICLSPGFRQFVPQPFALTLLTLHYLIHSLTLAYSFSISPFPIRTYRPF